MGRPIFWSCNIYSRSWVNMPEPTVHCRNHNKNSINQTQVVIEIHVNRAIQRVDYGERDAIAASIIPATAATGPLGVTFSQEELPTVVKLFPIKYDDLLSSDILGNCDIKSVISAIEDFVPGSTLSTSVLNYCKNHITSFFMKYPSLRSDGEGKPSLLSVIIPVQVVKVIETFDHYDDVEIRHSHEFIDLKCLRTPEMDQFLFRNNSSFFNLLEMKKFDGTKDSGECSICLQDFDEEKDGDDISLVELPCTHVFHTGCIINYLDAKSRCPICRYHFRVKPFHKPKCSCRESSFLKDKHPERQASSVPERRNV